jgi:hypothetical protein
MFETGGQFRYCRRFLGVRLFTLYYYSFRGVLLYVNGHIVFCFPVKLYTFHARVVFELFEVCYD